MKYILFFLVSIFFAFTACNKQEEIYQIQYSASTENGPVYVRYVEQGIVYSDTTTRTSWAKSHRAEAGEYLVFTASAATGENNLRVTIKKNGKVVRKLYTSSEAATGLTVNYELR